MLEIADYFYLFLIGSVGGFLAGMLGIGGGVIFVVILTYYMGFYPVDKTEIVKYVISNSLFATFFSGFSGSIKQVLQKTYYWREVLLTGLPGIISTLAVSYSIIHWNWYTKSNFSIIFLLMLLFFIWRIFFGGKPKVNLGEKYLKDLSPVIYVIGGILSGVISALSGLGGGILLIPLFHGFFKLNMLKTASLSLGVIPLFALANSFFYAANQGAVTVEIPYSLGYLVFPIVIPMVAGVFIFAPAGVWMANKIPQKYLRIIFGILLILIASKIVVTDFLLI